MAEYKKDITMSGLYIKGMEMPSMHNGGGVPEVFAVHGKIVVYPNGEARLDITIDNTEHTYSLVPVPDHGDLIDHDAYRDEYVSQVYDLCTDDANNWRANALIDLFDNAPVVIPADKEDK